jgi:hypothetical protein
MKEGLLKLSSPSFISSASSSLLIHPSALIPHPFVALIPKQKNPPGMHSHTERKSQEESNVTRTFPHCVFGLTLPILLMLALLAAVA